MASVPADPQAPRDFDNGQPLPPVLYWSPSLAARSNLHEGHDQRHGLIDATVASFIQHWVDGDGWCVLGRLPSDAIRLVGEQRAEDDPTHSMYCDETRCVNTCAFFETTLDPAVGAS